MAKYTVSLALDCRVDVTCEGFDEDWMDPDNEKFVMDVWMEDGFIVMGGNYRT